MTSGHNSSILRFEETNQVLVSGVVEDASLRTFISKDGYTFTTNDGQVFRLSPGEGVEGLECMSARRLSILGTIEEGEIPPVLTVLGYRIIPPPVDTSGSADSRPFIRRKAA